MDLNNEEKMESATNSTKLNEKRNFSERLYQFWTGRVMEYFSKANLFTICCVTAGLLLIVYLGAFSCEVSWLLEAHGDLPTPSYLLCAGYFIMFVASTILIHGLVTGLPWGLFSWSVIVGILSIPELAFVMIMTTQFWGLQSTHGLTELVGYLIRLIINCLTLLCVIPTALKWRREAKVLTQLQTLAARLQLQTPPPTTPALKSNSTRNSKKRRRSRRPSAYDNPGFVVNEGGMNPMFPPFQDSYSQNNEFNASIFGLHPGQYIGPYPPPQAAFSKRTQSLLDLRYVLPTFNQKSSIDECDGKILNNNIENLKNVNEKTKPPLQDVTSMKVAPDDPIYCTIDSNKSTKLARNCVSLENLEDITKLKNDLSYGNNLLQNYHFWPMMGGFGPAQLQQPPHYQFLRFPFAYYHHQHNPLVGCGGVGYGGFTHPYANRSNTNSKQSVGTSESDDYRKYRDVAL
ncbi:unnamed protein product [Hermetia illucens]|uniref:Uncharacterized protein n=1 Tax=Hermetia illucens TaxID=343691 RepID=A0A7R8U9U4_HERIL|nr:uncharacterized protein LOC119661640 [Hermetia illucens]CAD7076806.1 unnamed protein product [Hermetia illucens]